jgi:hypothetical protein
MVQTRNNVCIHSQVGTFNFNTLISKGINIRTSKMIYQSLNNILLEMLKSVSCITVLTFIKSFLFERELTNISVES